MRTSQYPGNALSGNLAVGITGYFFSPGRSIFLFFPLALLSLICFRRFLISHPPEAVFVAVLSGLWLLLHAKLVSWTGEWGWGPRYFVAIAPVLALPACVCWEWLQKDRVRRIILAGALSWGAVLSASSIISNWHYRMILAYLEKRDIIWSLTGGQPLDMIRGAVDNLRNVFLHVPPATISGIPYSPANQSASTTINVWLVTEAREGIHPIILAGVAVALMTVTGYCCFALRKMALRSSPAQDHIVA